MHNEQLIYMLFSLFFSLYVSELLKKIIFCIIKGFERFPLQISFPPGITTLISWHRIHKESENLWKLICILQKFMKREIQKQRGAGKQDVWVFLVFPLLESVIYFCVIIKFFQFNLNWTDKLNKMKDFHLFNHLLIWFCWVVLYYWRIVPKAGESGTFLFIR